MSLTEFSTNCINIYTSIQKKQLYYVLILKTQKCNIFCSVIYLITPLKLPL